MSYPSYQSPRKSQQLSCSSLHVHLPSYSKASASGNLELGLILHLLEDGLHLSRLHNIALDLQLPTHKQLLRIRFSLDQLSKIGIAQRHCDCRLLAIGSCAFACFAGVFEIDVPGFLSAGLVLEGEGEDGTAFFDGVGAFGGGGEGGVYGVESG